MRSRTLLSLAAVAVALCMQGDVSPAAARGRSVPPPVHVDVSDFAFDPGAPPAARELDHEVEAVVAALSTRAAARI